MEEQDKKEKSVQVEEQREESANEGSKDSRESRRKIRRKETKREKIRLIPIWLRLVIVLVLISISLAGGLVFGYGVIGDGAPLDALKPSTWNHIINIINGIES